MSLNHPIPPSLWNYGRKQVIRTLEDLTKKNLIDKGNMKMLWQEQNINTATLDFLLQPFQEARCPKCLIEIRGPKKYWIEHIKTHDRKFEKKENEFRYSELKPSTI